MFKQTIHKIICSFTLLFFLSGSVRLEAQLVYSYNFARVIGGADNDKIIDIVTDSAGNIYTCGNFLSPSLDFDPGPGTASRNNAGSSDIFLAKYNPGGNLIWVRSFGGIGEDMVSSIDIDQYARLYICGSFKNSVDFDPGSSAGNLTSAGEKDAFVARFDSSGAYIWAGAIGGSGDDIANDIKFENTYSQFYLCGSFESTADLDPGNLNYNKTSAGGSDIFLIRFNSQNSFVYGHSLGGSGNDIGNCLSIDRDLNIHIGGTFTGTVNFDFFTAGSDFISRNGSPDVFIAKYDDQYNLKWKKQIAGSSDDFITDMETDTMGNVSISGGFKDSCHFYYVPGYYSRVAKGAMDGYILNINGPYAINSLQIFSGDSVNSAVYINSIYLDEDGRLFSTGMANDGFDAAPFDYDTAMLKINSQVAFILETDVYGNYNKSEVITAGSKSAIPYAFCLDSDKNIIVGGSFTGSADFDPNFNERIQSNTYGESDIFLAKYSKCVMLLPKQFKFLGDTVCSGKSTYLSFNSGAFGITYSWYSEMNGGQYLGYYAFNTPVLNNNTTFYIQDSGCNVVRRTPHTVSVIPSPDKTLNQSNRTLTAASGNYTYQWFNCDLQQNINGETSVSFTAVTDGNYSVKITDKNTGCETITDCYEIKQTSNKQILADHSFSLYPNPASTQLHVKTSSAESIYYIIIDFSGREVLSGHTEHDSSIDISSLSEGQYLFKTSRGNLITFTVLAH